MSKLNVERERSISMERLRRLFSYKPDIGLLVHGDGVYRRSTVGKPAGHIRKSDGYVQASIDRHSFYAHRIIWALVHDKWPDAQIDHRNGDRSDNRICNLREASAAQNVQNTVRQPGLSGLLGACWDKKRGLWVSFCQHRYLGTFNTPEEASAAYARAAADAYGEFARVA